MNFLNKCLVEYFYKHHCKIKYLKKFCVQSTMRHLWKFRNRMMVTTDLRMVGEFRPFIGN